MTKVATTDRLPLDDLRPVLMGLFGEVGSIMATAKKLHREGGAYAGYRHAVEEEFGDALWYFAALCRRLQLNADDILIKNTTSEEFAPTIVSNYNLDSRNSLISAIDELPCLDETLLKLGEATALLLKINTGDENVRILLKSFMQEYFCTLQVAHVSFSKIVYSNIEKTCGRFLESDSSLLPTFDSNFPEEERLPCEFEINITQRKSGRIHLRWNGVFIGDPLTDNILDADGFRFHDVFHLANAAILHWSPTFRGLIKQKRKSDPVIDEAEDGGRAIVVEEGLIAWIFSRAKYLNFFEGQDSISFDLLKVVQQFVQGYEVEACPLNLWERAILDGYAVFREVRTHNSGIIIGSRNSRTIKFMPLARG